MDKLAKVKASLLERYEYWAQKNPEEAAKVAAGTASPPPEPEPRSEPRPEPTPTQPPEPRHRNSQDREDQRRASDNVQQREIKRWIPGPRTEQPSAAPAHNQVKKDNAMAAVLRAAEGLAIGSEPAPAPEPLRVPHRQRTSDSSLSPRQDEASKRKQGERRKQETDGIVRRQQEADAAARAARSALTLHQLPAPSAVPLSTAPSAYTAPRNLTMPLETPREDIPSDTEPVSSRYSGQSVSSFRK